MNIEGEKRAQTTQVKILLAIISLIFFTLIFKSFFVGALIFLGLFIHERGHLRAAEYLGLSHRGIYFLPGLGAVALLDDMPKSRSQECFVAIAGPAHGMAYSCLLAALAGLSPWAAISLVLAKAAFFNSIINLFNLLIPVDPLDGGRILKSITFSLHPIIGFLMLICSASIAIFLASKGLILFVLVSFAAIAGILEEKKIYKTRPTMRWFDAIYGAIAVAVIACVLLFSAGFGMYKVPELRPKNSDTVSKVETPIKIIEEGS